MNKNTKARITTLAAGAALFAVVGGGSAVAGSLVTSAQIKDNTIRSADVLNGGLRGADIKDSSLRGGDIADGTVRGADIADGTLSNQDINVLTASVNSDGALHNSSGGVTATRTNTGNYAVDFGRNIKDCAFFATAGGTQIGSEVGQVNVSDKSGNPNAVFVWTTDSAGADNDMDFHLAVVC